MVTKHSIQHYSSTSKARQSKITNFQLHSRKHYNTQASPKSRQMNSNSFQALAEEEDGHSNHSGAMEDDHSDLDEMVIDTQYLPTDEATAGHTQRSPHSATTPRIDNGHLGSNCGTMSDCETLDTSSLIEFPPITSHLSTKTTTEEIPEKMQPLSTVTLNVSEIQIDLNEYNPSLQKPPPPNRPLTIPLSIAPKEPSKKISSHTGILLLLSFDDDQINCYRCV